MWNLPNSVFRLGDISAGPVCRQINGSVTGYVYGYLLEMPVCQCDCSSELGEGILTSVFSEFHHLVLLVSMHYVALICNSLLANEVEHIFKCILVIY